MKPRVHFCLHFDADFPKFTALRDCLDPQSVEVLPFLSHDQWARLVRTGDDFVVRWIDKQISSADAVVVLIGERTYTRALIRTEINHAMKKGRPMFGIQLYDLADAAGVVQTEKGQNPFDYVMGQGQNAAVRLPVHSWSAENGPGNFKTWLGNSLGR